MSNKYGSLLLVAVVASIAQIALGSSHLGMDTKSFVNINGTMYYISPADTQNPAEQSESFCTDLGLQLVSLETQQEFDNVQTYLNSLPELSNHKFWTSGHKYLSNYEWAGTLTEFEYVKWEQYEPNNGPCVCIYIQGGTNGLFDDICNKEIGFICE